MKTERRNYEKRRPCDNKASGHPRISMGNMALQRNKAYSLNIHVYSN